MRLVSLHWQLALLAIPTLGPCSIRGQSSPPHTRAHHALVYHDSLGRVLLTGGSTPEDSGRRFLLFDDLWMFDGARWSPLTPSGEKLSGVGLAYDTKRDRVLSFGGYDGRSRGDLRVLDGLAWRTIGAHPRLQLAEPGFVYDSRRDRFVLFGGSSGPGESSGETWEYDGTKWERVDVDGPPPRMAQAMVYDQRRGRVVVFGGMGAPGIDGRPSMLGDTWEFDGKRWERRDVAGPSARASAGAAYDSRRGVVVIFGGVTSDGFAGDTWAWDGRAWRKLADIGPDGRGMGYLAYDRQRDRIVLFGGRKGWPNGDLNDTWEWNGSTWTRVVP